MQTEDHLRTLQAACSDVRRASQLLCSPSPAQLDRCAALLRAAVARLEEWRALPGARNGAARALQEAFRLRAAILHAGGLLESAARYHAGWSRLIGAMSAGYAPGGAPAAVARPARLCLHG
jgi:tRNA U34 5-methylaminomethyl-2-thiouridine-forming methyltransferase MnmC